MIVFLKLLNMYIVVDMWAQGYHKITEPILFKF